MAAPRLAAIACLAAMVLSVPAPARAGDAAPRIPLVVGLTTIRSVVETQGDYESIRTYTSVTKEAYSFVNRAEVPDGPGLAMREIKVSRTVPVADQRHARKMRNRFNTGDPEVFPGTTPGVSSDLLNELRAAGTAAMTFIDARQTFGMTNERTLKGSVTRVGAGAEDFSLIVNGRRVTLRTLHAKGRLGDAGGTHEVEFQVLDDPDNPLMLSSSGPGFSSRITRIEYPEAASSATSIESTLAANKPAEIYGIYFSFGSATLRPESDRVLREVADLLTKHRDWKLQIDGHTDNVGGAPANLDLSRRRGAAVKAALVQRHAIAGDRLASGGFGETRPKDSNDTVEGRALNRRVELRRL
jgi:outer membrane protein OmpA-like peptidoglycan-associated protein